MLKNNTTQEKILKQLELQNRLTFDGMIGARKKEFDNFSIKFMETENLSMSLENEYRTIYHNKIKNFLIILNSFCRAVIQGDLNEQEAKEDYSEFIKKSLDFSSIKNYPYITKLNEQWQKRN